MTFTGSESRSEMVPTIPAAVSGRGEAQSVALALALELGFEPFSFSGDRRAYHAAAVLSGNFGTVLLARAAEILATQGIPIAQARRILAPLTIQSIRNAAAMPPEAVLTGPVARGDQDVIQSHIQAIQEHAPENVDLYITLLQSATSLLDHREANSD
jgi:predicted short-subunit dehydrogenase-like oxidoreductase (DUF2520 family)